MSRVLATYNIKGGVGKTSAAVNLAYLAARGGSHTLLWDLDPQGASTYLFRVKPKVRGGGRRLVRGKTAAEPLIKATDYDRLDLLPADFSYRHMDLALDSGRKNNSATLRRVLDPLRGDYDYVFLDCPPSISLVSENVFEAADALLVPIIPATLSSRTFEQLSELVEGGPQVLAFFSMVEVRKSLHREVMTRLRAAHVTMLGASIPSADEVERMGLERRVVAEIAPRSRAALSYEALWWDVRRRLAARAG
jgi:cellulose biosynthesis protein BcsQ